MLITRDFTNGELADKLDSYRSTIDNVTGVTVGILAEISTRLRDTASNTRASQTAPSPVEDKDGARYRWLRDQKAYVAVQPHYKDLPKSLRTGWTIRLVYGDDSSFDAAIDRALAQQGAKP